MLTDLSRVVGAPGRRVAAEAEAVASVRVLISLHEQRLGTLMSEVRARETLEAEYPAARTWASVMSTTGSTARDAGTFQAYAYARKVQHANNDISISGCGRAKG